MTDQGLSQARWSDRLFELSVDMLGVAGMDGYFKRINGAWSRVLGHSSESILAVPYLDLVHPDDRASTLAEAAKLGEGATTARFVNRYSCADGGWRWLAWTAVPSVEDGMIYCIARDITDERASVEHEAANQARLRSLFQTAITCIIEADDLGRVTDWNTEAERTFGWSREEILGRSLAETIIPARFREAHTRGMAHHAATGEGPVLGQTLELAGLRRDGEEFPIELSISPAQGHDGKRSFIAFARDIGARKRSERLEALRLQVTRTLAESRDAGEMAPILLGQIATSFGWDVGEFWRVRAEDNLLHRSASWTTGAPGAKALVTAREALGLARGKGMPGMAWATGEVIVVPELSKWVDFASPWEAKAAGMVTGLALPMPTGDGGCDVFTFFSAAAKTYDADLLHTLESLASQVRQFLDRDQSDQRIRAILENVGDGIVTVDANGRIESFNHSAHRLLGYSPAEVIGQPISTLVVEDREGDFVDYLANLLRPGKNALTSGAHETTGRRKDGSSFPMEFVATDMQMGGRRLFIATLRDISERRAQTDALEFQALHDALTGLPNRTLFRDRVTQATQDAGRNRTEFGLILLDMDRFKEVNDVLGHEAGDQLLAAFATRLRGFLRESDTVARLGGDEFAVLAGKESGTEALLRTAARITAALEKPFMLGATAIQVRASMGIAVFPGHGGDVDTLMRRADVAMYVAKRSGTGHAIYASQQEETMKRRVTLLSDLRVGISDGQLRLEYQPWVDVATRRTLGLEALVRWAHPRFGMVPPDEFIGVAEGSELIGPLTRWVLGEALAQLHAWDQIGLDIQVSVNLSAMNLRDRELPAMVATMLRGCQIEPTRLTLEITESTALSDDVDHTLAALRDLGCGLSLDDFGTGYASLSYLRRLPLTQLKIDRSFVTGMAQSEADAAIVRPAISLAHNLGLTVTAEGVEDADCFEMLATFGCNYVQGYHVSAPLPAADVPAWLEKRGNGF